MRVGRAWGFRPVPPFEFVLAETFMLPAHQKNRRPAPVGDFGLLVASSLLFCAAPASVVACACGCGVFDVGTATMLPAEPGLQLFLEDDYQDQDQNWVGSHAAPASVNTDKEIATHFGSVGIDYQVNNDWGMEIRVPYWDRLFRTDIGSAGSPDVVSFRHRALGDIQITGRYTGFAPDLSSGITVGVKLPTGDWTYADFDRDTSIGTGTTDLLLGAYHLGPIGDSRARWFLEGLVDRAFNMREGYRPGNELDVAAGALYEGIPLGQRGSLTALMQIIGSNRHRDSGVNSDPDNSGYRRALLSPGLEASIGRWKYYADAEFRLYHHANAAPAEATTGTQGQLVAPVLLKVMVSYHF
jgi:hypothetical protein